MKSKSALKCYAAYSVLLVLFIYYKTILIIQKHKATIEKKTGKMYTSAIQIALNMTENIRCVIRKQF